MAAQVKLWWKQYQILFAKDTSLDAAVSGMFIRTQVTKTALKFFLSDNFFFFFIILISGFGEISMRTSSYLANNVS